MVNSLKVVVVEDSLYKFTMLRGALGAVSAQSMFADCQVEHHTRATTLVERPVAKLADVDVFFVDFDLQTGRYSQDGPVITVSPLREFAPDPAARRSREVEVTTGMGVLLHLDDTFRSEEYLAARGERAPAAVYAYVDLAECRARYFAAAAQSWFGVPLFPFAPTDQMVTNLERHPVPSAAAGKIARSVPLLDSLLNHFTEATTPSWVTPRGSHAFNWLRALERHGCAPSTATYVPALVTRATVNPTELLHDTLVARLYAKVLAFEAALEPEDVKAWPRQDAKPDATSRRRVRGTLAGELTDSALFWRADDVRAALLVRRPLVARRTAEAAEAAATAAAAKADMLKGPTYDSATRNFLRNAARRR